VNHALGRQVDGTTTGHRGLDSLAGGAFEAVLFDMDGTLVDSTASVRRSWQAWAAEYDIEPERLVGWHGVPARQILQTLLPAEDVEAALARIEGIEVADAAGIALLPGAAQALDDVPARRCAIVTSCTTPLAWARIEGTGLRAPNVVVTASDVPRGKPDPAPYLLAAERLGVDPATCLVVEDAPAGLEAAQRAGCATLAVVTTHAWGDLDADAVVPTLAHVRFAADPQTGLAVLRHEAGEPERGTT
jgi:sugar-phosphatase